MPLLDHRAADDLPVVGDADRIFLEEYSHLSASEVFIPYLGAVTKRIHIGSGIFNLNPEVRKMWEETSYSHEGAR
jgi:alkanesulfonate monooxygenase SsuD/methylene tetrahydromethanopterin reductase-like flavin-dependent oxidoreductase (luciferase family)